MKTLVLIPARGGSKGIPGKNIKPFAGAPLISYSIDVARTVADDSDICVSTDSHDIISVVRNLGLQVPFIRPLELATDKAGTREVIIHALDFYKSRGVDYNTVLLLQPTSPLRSTADVKNCLALYHNDLDMVVSVKESSANPYYNCFEKDSNGYLKISKGDGNYTRRQDAPEVLEINGAVYVINADSIRKMPIGSFTKKLPYMMPAERSIDLDTPFDWIVAEQWINTLKAND